MSKPVRAWAPCPWCFDDGTFELKVPRGPRKCSKCRRHAAIVRDESGRLVAIPTRRTKRYRSNKRPPKRVQKHRKKY